MRIAVLLVLIIAVAHACSSTQGSAMQQCVCGLTHSIGNINWHSCRKDFNSAHSNIDKAVNYLENGIHHKSKTTIKAGLKYLAKGLREIGSSLDDCKIAAIAEDLAKLAASMESGWGEIETAVKIIVKGFNVYDDVYDIIVDYRHHKYYDLGKKIYDLIKIVA